MLPDVIAGAALLFVAMSNIRGLSANRIGTVLRLSLLSIVVLVAVSLIGFATTGTRADPRLHRPRRGAEWEDLIFALGIASVAAIGVEAASGLAGEIRVGRRGLRRVVLVSIAACVLLFVLVSVAALMATPVVGTRTALGDRFLEAPVLGHRLVLRARRAARREPLRGGRHRRRRCCSPAMNGQMLGLARLAYSLATNRQIPSAVGRLQRAPRDPLRDDHPSPR